MNEQMRSVVEKFAAEDIFGSAMVMELLRFRALDQIISSNAGTREWGVTVDKLFGLAAQSTTDTFGPLPYDQDGFGRLYGPSFAVDPFDVISETGFIDGLAAGRNLTVPMEEVLAEHEGTEGVILFAYVEEYAGLVDTILQSLPAERVVLYTTSESCYDVLHALYPLASITMEWPEDVIFDHVVAASCGMFQPPSYVIEEMASRVGNVTEEGTLHYFLPVACIQDQKGIHKVSLQYLLLQKQLKAIREWAPTGCYEFVFGSQTVKKVALEIREVLEDNTYRTTPFIALPNTVLAGMEVFTIVDYALSLCSVPIVGDPKQVSLGDDGYLGTDPRLPAYMRKVFTHVGTARLSVEKEGNAFAVHMNTVEGPDIDTVLGMPEVLGHISEEEVPTTLYWQFENPVAQYIWYSYFKSPAGQEVLKHLSQFVLTPAAMYQLMGSCRRQFMSKEELHAVAQAFNEGHVAYEKAKEEAELAWKATYETIATKALPPRDERVGREDNENNEDGGCSGSCSGCPSQCQS